MFKAKFEDINMNSQPLKATVAKKLRDGLTETYPNCAEYIESLWPSKAKVLSLKIKGESHYHFIKIDEEIAFIEIRDKPLIPVLRVLHKYPNMLAPMTCDKGAIKHIFSGSHVMAPGLTSEGGCITAGLEAGHPVAIMAEGKKHAMAVGFLQMSSADIQEKGKGEAIEVIHSLNDQVWKEIN